jgi:hypothetical protein
MAFRILNDDPIGEFPEVPWLKDYLDDHDLYDVPDEELADLLGILVGPKGILLFTKDFKGFLFKGSRGYEVLSELIAQGVYTGRLGVFSKGKKPILVSDEDAGDNELIPCGGGKYFQNTVDPNRPPSSTRSRKKPKSPAF